MFPKLGLGFAAALADFQQRWTEEWHRADASVPQEDADPFFVCLREQHRSNFLLWHLEDEVRVPNTASAIVGLLKRRIDQRNQERNDRIEQLDQRLALALAAGGATLPEARWNTETPGMAIDRLSILALKVYHMRAESLRLDSPRGHTHRCAVRLQILQTQRADLIQALTELLEDLLAGRKVMKIYRQFKMYNDPELNPEVYKAARPS